MESNEDEVIEILDSNTISALLDRGVHPAWPQEGQGTKEATRRGASAKRRHHGRDLHESTENIPGWQNTSVYKYFLRNICIS